MKEIDLKKMRDNPVQTAAYLDEAFATDNLTEILGALRNALRAQNVMALSRATGLRRDRLYKTFGGEIEPNFSRVLKLLEGLDVQITIVARKERKPKPPLPKLGRPSKSATRD